MRTAAKSPNFIDGMLVKFAQPEGGVSKETYFVPVRMRRGKWEVPVVSNEDELAQRQVEGRVFE